MPEWQQILIAQIVDTLKRNYILWEGINEKFQNPTLKDWLTVEFATKFSGEKYQTMPNDEISGKQFASDVSDILGKLIGDKHLQLAYAPADIEKHKEVLNTQLKFPFELPVDHAKFQPIYTPEEIEDHSKDYIKRGCGFYDMTTIKTRPDIIISSTRGELRRAERMAELERDKQVNIPDNVGYVGMFMVADPKSYEVVKEKLFDTMKALEGKDAIILDLRGNTGGSPEGVRHLLSYLLEKPTLINTIVERIDGEDKPVPFNTYPHNSPLLIPEKRRDQQVPDLSAIPLYVLTDKHTFSAGEEIAYDLQQQPQRGAVLIGAHSRTKGGAHPSKGQPLFIDKELNSDTASINNCFLMVTPYGASKGPLSGTNWERIGVKPEITVAPGANALQIAVNLAIINKLENSRHAGMLSAFNHTPLKEFLAKEEQPNAAVTKAYEPNDSLKPSKFKS